MAARHGLSGPLTALTLGVAALVVPAGASGQAPAPAHTGNPEVVITATRETDAVLAARIERAMQDDPYLFVNHVSVSAENGVVRLEGVVEDPFDMLQLVRMARRIAGKRRVINEIEVVSGGVDHD